MISRKGYLLMTFKSFVWWYWFPELFVLCKLCDCVCIFCSWWNAIGCDILRVSKVCINKTKTHSFSIGCLSVTGYNLPYCILYLHYTVCPQKKVTKIFFVISSIKLRRCWRNLVHSFLNKFASRINLMQNYVNVVCLTWIMSLRYLVQLKMLIVHVIPLSC